MSIRTCMENLKLAYDGYLADKANYKKLFNALTDVSINSFTQLNFIERERKREMKQEKKLGLEKDERPKAKIIGEDSNIFNIMGIASNSLKNAGFKDEANEMFKRVTESGSYDEALGIIMEYVEATDSDYNLEEKSLEMKNY